MRDYLYSRIVNLPSHHHVYIDNIEGKSESESKTIQVQKCKHKMVQLAR